MVKKRSKMTIISDILRQNPCRQRYSDHARSNVAAKKKKLPARKGTRVSSFLEGNATLFPGTMETKLRAPASHVLHTCLTMLRRRLSP